MVPCFPDWNWVVHGQQGPVQQVEQKSGDEIVRVVRYIAATEAADLKLLSLVQYSLYVVLKTLSQKCKYPPVTSTTEGQMDENLICAA